MSHNSMYVFVDYFVTYRGQMYSTCSPQLQQADRPEPMASSPQMWNLTNVTLTVALVASRRRCSDKSILLHAHGTMEFAMP
jgi:hypothetical protein